MAQEKVRDMTEGSPLKLIIGFAVPMFLGFLFQQLYSMVDTIIVGKYLGVTALAAVGSTGSVNFMINGFCIGVCSGFAIPVAQKFGARDYSGLRRFVANAAWLAIGVSVVMTAVVSALCMDILVWMKTPEDILYQAHSYIFIIFLGIPTTFLYNMTSGIIRSLGDSKTPVYFLLMASILNIGLDLFMIVVLKMGPAGAAWATVISQGVSGALCLLFMRSKYPVLKMAREEMRVNGNLMLTLCSMGIPMGFQYSITAIGNVILQTAVNSLGSMAVAAVTAGGRIGFFFCSPYDALGGTMATWAGQNVGAGKIDRVREGVRYAGIMGVLYSILAFAVLFLWGADFFAVCRPRGDGDPPSGMDVPGGQQYVLYCPGVCQRDALCYPGNGIQHLCDYCRGLRDGGTFSSRVYSGSHFRLFCRLHWQPGRLDPCRYVFNTGLLLLPEKAEGKNGRTEWRVTE